jgi:aspartyl-tRNA(Asn)/glutamyl-tRNA(Gln) amidotransferase subunit B
MTLKGCIGLEIHIALKTKTKLFCSCPLDAKSEANSNVCPVCLGHPGVLPSLNNEAVKQGLRIVTALEMQVPEELRFDRKHYIYPDLSKNFQTSQFYFTLGRGGSLGFKHQGKAYSISLREAHLEEDAAKLIHQDDESMVDYNRGGTPLLELVTEPVLHSGLEAELVLRNLRLLLRRIEASEANMELAQMRCDANVSVSEDGQPTGTRVEIKNLNSPRFVKQAIEYEIGRQRELLARGGKVVQETRLWNENRGITQAMRSKESAHDYRYLPEPDLPVVALPPELISAIGSSLPELPEARIARYLREYSLSYEAAWRLLDEPAAEKFFLACVEILPEPELIYSWLTNQVAELLKEKNTELYESCLSPAKLVEIIRLKQDGAITSSNAKLLLKLVLETAEEVPVLLQNHKLILISDESRIRSWIAQALEKNNSALEAYIAGKRAVFGFLKGETLRRSGGQADPARVDLLLGQALAEKEESR